MVTMILTKLTKICNCTTAICDFPMGLGVSNSGVSRLLVKIQALGTMIQLSRETSVFFLKKYIPGNSEVTFDPFLFFIAGGHLMIPKRSLNESLVDIQLSDFCCETFDVSAASRGLCKPTQRRLRIFAAGTFFWWNEDLVSNGR